MTIRRQFDASCGSPFVVLLCLCLASGCSSDEETSNAGGTKPKTSGGGGGAAGRTATAGRSSVAGAAGKSGTTASEAGSAGTRVVPLGGNRGTAGSAGQDATAAGGTAGATNLQVAGSADAGNSGGSGGSATADGGTNTGGSSGSGGTAGMAGTSSAAAGASNQCPPGSAYRATGGTGSCVACSIKCPQMEQGETDEYVATRSGGCFCQTDPGYFHPVDGTIAEPCDLDGDGWVRDSALLALTSDDPALKENARCALRRISHVVLRNESGQEKRYYFTGAETAIHVSAEPPVAAQQAYLPLYESVRNDDDSKLRTGGNPIPLYGTKALTAKTLNSFTKACVKGGDHNDNLIIDVEEWAKLPDAGQSVGPTVADMRAPFVPMYTRFSYYVELHQGAFTSANGSSLGYYTIYERQRAYGEADRIGMRYGLEPQTGLLTSDFWQYCPRARDLGYSNDYNATTYDFASVSGPGAFGTDGLPWQGMMHHSQFKCVQVFNESEQIPSTVKEQEKELYRQSPSTIAALRWQANQCYFDSIVPAATGVGVNPDMPVITCNTTDSPQAGTLLWAAVRIPDITDYRRGCVKQCAGYKYLCPGSDPAGPPGSCYSMCADFSASYPLTIGSTAATGYSLRGEVSTQIWGWPTNSGSTDPYVIGNPTSGYSIRVLGAP